MSSSYYLFIDLLTYLFIFYFLLQESTLLERKTKTPKNTYSTIRRTVKVHLKESLLFLQDNSRNEWAFQRAITIQTYRNYHPVPVPFNIISIPAMEVYGFLKKKAGKTKESNDQSQVSLYLKLPSRPLHNKILDFNYVSMKTMTSVPVISL